MVALQNAYLNYAVRIRRSFDDKIFALKGSDVTSNQLGSADTS